MGTGLSVMLWLALGNLFLILDCLAQSKYKRRYLVLLKLICLALLILMGGLFLSEQKQRRNILRER